MPYYYKHGKIATDDLFSTDMHSLFLEALWHKNLEWNDIRDEELSRKNLRKNKREDKVPSWKTVIIISDM